MFPFECLILKRVNSANLAGEESLLLGRKIAINWLIWWASVIRVGGFRPVSTLPGPGQYGRIEHKN
jgi:hypothetical protein